MLCDTCKYLIVSNYREQVCAPAFCPSGATMLLCGFDKTDIIEKIEECEDYEKKCD